MLDRHGLPSSVHVAELNSGNWFGGRAAAIIIIIIDRENKEHEVKNALWLWIVWVCVVVGWRKRCLHNHPLALA